MKRLMFMARRRGPALGPALGVALGFATLSCSDDPPPPAAPADARMETPSIDADTLCTPEKSTTFYADSDGDGFGTPDLTAVECEAPDGFVDNDLDCDDTDTLNNPDGIEVCDGLDNDCDETTIETCLHQCTPQNYDSHSYLFCIERNNHASAETACEAERMHLVQVDDQLEQTWISDQRTASFGSKTEMWIGASDKVTENTWVWAGGPAFWQGRANGTAVDGLFAYWRGGEPNDDPNEDCAIFSQSDLGKWDDRSCSNLKRFVCERTRDTP